MEFFVEGSLKGLNKWLRFLGYKTRLCEKKITSEIVFENKDKIFLITSPETAKICEKIGVIYLVLPREDLNAQIQVLINKLNLKLQLKLDICSICGTELIPIKKEDFKDLIPPKVYKFYNEFNYCPNCKKIYWEGDHIKRLKKKFKDIISKL